MIPVRPILPALVWLPLAAPGHAQEGAGDAARLVVTVSVDWEGNSLEAGNVAAMAALREQFPKVPLTHFLCAAYFTHPDAPDDMADRLREVFADADEVGLHIHCWQSLVEGAGVEFRDRPTYWGRPARRRPGSDPGHEVELDAYELEEIRSIVSYSLDLLEERDFEVSASFRCGGWLASPKVLEAVRAEGFEIDSSATDARWHQEELGQLAIQSRLRELWPEVTALTQPYVIETPAGEILEMPDTGALADYVTGEEMIEHLKLALAAVPDGKLGFAHIGFHQETAARFLPRVQECLAHWAADPRVRFETLQAAAAIHRAQVSTAKEHSR